MSKTVELLFDFVSPNAYLIWQPLRQLAKDHGAALEITPVFLGGMHKLTGNAPPMIRDAEVKGKNAYAMLEMNRFIARHGLNKFTMNAKFPFNSVTLQRLLVAAAPAEREQVAGLLLAQIWEEGLDPTDPEAIGGALDAGGFDAQRLLAATQNPAVKQQLMDNTSAAIERGAFGIPTIYVTANGQTEMFFGKERLGQIEELLGG